jgi:hypothetical protein
MIGDMINIVGEKNINWKNIINIHPEGIQTEKDTKIYAVGVDAYDLAILLGSWTG